MAVCDDAPWLRWWLCVQTLYDADADNLKAWWLKCPRKQVTTLDTHDGIPVVDLSDVLTTDQVNRTQERILANGANVNDRYNPKAQDNEVYQACCCLPSSACTCRRGLSPTVG